MKMECNKDEAGTPFAGNQESSARSTPPIFRYVRSRNQASLETFWTGCGRCRIKYEYEKVLLGRLLQCPTCLNPFLAVAMPAPPSRRQQQDPVVASGGPTNLPPSVARTPQPQAESGPGNVGTTVPGGLHREKPVKRRRKECVGAKELSKRQIRVMLMGRAKMDALNQLNKWKSAKSDTLHSKRVDRRDSLDAFDQVGSGVHPRTAPSEILQKK